MQYWSVASPCAYCPATSNISHDPKCQNYGIYDEDGRIIPFVPDSHQLRLEFPS